MAFCSDLRLQQRRLAKGNPTDLVNKTHKLFYLLGKISDLSSNITLLLLVLLNTTLVGPNDNFEAVLVQSFLRRVSTVVRKRYQFLRYTVIPPFPIGPTSRKLCSTLGNN